MENNCDNLDIKYATTSDEVAAVDVVTLAFSTDPVARWMYPNPHQYLTNMPPFVRAYGGKAFVHGSAYYVEGYMNSGDTILN